MRIDEKTVVELREWAKSKRPLWHMPTARHSRYRSVKLEIVAEANPRTDAYDGGVVMERVMARVYLIEPLCFGKEHHGFWPECECGPLAELRIG